MRIITIGVNVLHPDLRIKWYKQKPVSHSMAGALILKLGRCQVWIWRKESIIHTAQEVYRDGTHE